MSYLSASLAVRMSPSISHTHISINIQAGHFFSPIPQPIRSHTMPYHTIRSGSLRSGFYWWSTPNTIFAPMKQLHFVSFLMPAPLSMACANGSRSAVAHVKHSWRAFKAEEKQPNPIQYKFQPDNSTSPEEPFRINSPWRKGKSSTQSRNPH